jgi:hypothetical protein
VRLVNQALFGIFNHLHSSIATNANSVESGESPSGKKQDDCPWHKNREQNMGIKAQTDGRLVALRCNVVRRLLAQPTPV